MSVEQKSGLAAEEMPSTVTAMLMAEIKNASGKSHRELASDLSPYIDLSDKMIGQYLSGAKSMSEARLLQLAKAADNINLSGELIAQLLMWSKLSPADGRVEFKELSSTLQKKVKRAEKAAIKKYEKAVAELISMDWADSSLVALTILATRKKVPEHERTNGGLINQAALEACLGNDPTYYPNMAYVFWKIKDIGDVTPEDLME